MRILFIHNKYLISGGEDVSTQSEIDMLKDHGHYVDALYVSNDDLASKSKFSIAVDTIWSNKYYQIVKNLIKVNNYDLVHVQNFLPQISPSVFYAAKNMGVKVVMSVRNYRLICPNALMYTHGKICDKCVGLSIPTPSIGLKCYKESLSATSVVASMLSIHNFLNTWNTKIDGYIAISQFVRDQMIRGGIDQSRIHVKHNFVKNPPDFRENPDSPDYVYVGRLSTEKGIDFLLDAFASEKLVGVRLKIIGDGPQKENVENYQQKFNNIKYLGRLSLKDTYEVMGNSRALIFPSQWHEPFGRTIVESFSAGTPVIASSVGGVTELVKNDYNGFLYNSDSLAGLQDAILHMENHTNYRQLRQNARTSYLQNYTSDKNYGEMINIYQHVLNAN